MAEKKSTSDIMAALRAEAAKKKAAAAGETPPAEPAAGAPPEVVATPDPAMAEPSPTSPPVKPAGGAKPKSTADILAAARAQKAAGEAPAAAAPAGNGDQPAAPKPAGGAKPKSTADILAAARGQKAAGATATAAPAAKPAAAKPAAGKPAAAVAAGGAKPSVEEMLRAVRAGQPMAAAAAPKAPAPKPVRKPAAARAARGEAQTEPNAGRRSFVMGMLASPFVLAWIFFVGAFGAFTAGLARFLMPNVLVEPPSRFNVGSLGKYSPDSVSEDYKASNGVWIVRTSYEGQEMLYALISVCTHLGCTPGWLQGEQKFKCPCHGSGYYITGINFEGPAPRPLERAGIFLMPDGSVEVDKSMKFQQEMGQWNDAASYIKLS